MLNLTLFFLYLTITQINLIKKKIYKLKSLAIV